MMQTEIAEILEEDARRRERLHRPYDPLAGDSGDPDRFCLQLEDFARHEVWLPESMRSEPLIERLLQTRSFALLAGTGRGRRRRIKKLKLRFIRLRMLHDFPFWACTAVRIKGKGGGADVEFRLNSPQRKLIGCFERMRLASQPIRVILLKARQWGGSTCVQIYMAWLQMLHSEGLNSLIIAHQGAGSDEIKDMFDRMLLSYPTELLRDPDSDSENPKSKGKQKITERVGRSGMAMRVCARNCKIKIGSAERPDSCRGGDYNLVHLSEVGIWKATDGKSPEDIVRSACGGVRRRPLTMIVYESTANGTGNFFHREYLAATRGESQFTSVFVSWFEIEQYSLPLSEEQRAERAARLLAGRESDATTDRTESGRYYWRLWQRGASLDALHWYEQERAKYNDHARMAAEYPSDDLEAFAHSGQPVFVRADVEALRADCHAPIARGEVESHTSDEDSIADLYFHPSPGGALEVWEYPDLASGITDRYVAVVDVGGRTAKADWSVITVIDRAGMCDGGRAAIAAQWRGHCDWDRLAFRAARIAAWYDEALLVVESNTLESRDPARMLDAGGGELPFILHQIRDLYPNLYVRGAGIENLRDSGGYRIGFHTNAATKPMVIASLIRAVREGLYIERSDAAVDEMLSYERRPNGSYGAIAGCHDDILMTRAIGLHIAFYEMDAPRRRMPRPSGRRRAPRSHRPLSEAFI